LQRSPKGCTNVAAANVSMAGTDQAALVAASHRKEKNYTAPSVPRRAPPIPYELLESHHPCTVGGCSSSARQGHDRRPFQNPASATNHRSSSIAAADRLTVFRFRDTRSEARKWERRRWPLRTHTAQCQLADQAFQVRSRMEAVYEPDGGGVRDSRRR
jgi:hypothetical protein